MTGVTTLIGKGCPVGHVVSGACLGEGVKSDTKEHERVSRTHATVNHVLHFCIAGSKTDFHSTLRLVETRGVVLVGFFLKECLIVAGAEENDTG